jgi:hypothetical protein
MLSYIFHQHRPDDIKFEWPSIQTAITWLFSADARPFIDMDSSSLNSLYTHRPCCHCPCHCVRPCRLTIHSTTSAIVSHPTIYVSARIGRPGWSSCTTLQAWLEKSLRIYGWSRCVASWLKSAETCPCYPLNPSSNQTYICWTQRCDSLLFQPCSGDLIKISREPETCI